MKHARLIQKSMKMDKEEFVKKKRELEELIRPLETQLKELKKQYVESNQPFKIGEKVEVITPAHKDFMGNEIPEKKRFAFVCRCDYIDRTESFKVEVYKAKKDGTESRVADYVTSRDIIKKIN